MNKYLQDLCCYETFWKNLKHYIWFQTEQLEGAASCNLLYNAFRRYTEIVQNLPPLVSKDSATAINLHSNYTGELEKLVVSLNGICDDSAYPVLFMDEACKFKWYIVLNIICMFLLTISDSLSIADGAGRLSANSVWGVLRGLETFSQLLYLGSDKITVCNNLQLTASSFGSFLTNKIDLTTFFFYYSKVQINVHLT